MRPPFDLRFLCSACALWRGTRIILLAAVSFVAANASAASALISLQQVDRANANGALGAIDLTMGGLALDWLKPAGTNLSFAEKDQANLLNFSLLGSFTPANYSDDGYTFSWTGGDSGSVSGSGKQGSNDSSATIGRGFRLNFVAPSAGDFAIYYYSAANHSAGNLGNYQLAAFLGAAQLATKSPINNIGSDSVDELVWAVQITADSAGQSFDLDLTRLGATNGALAITGAAVVAVPEPVGISFLGLGSLVALRRRRTHAQR